MSAKHATVSRKGPRRSTQDGVSAVGDKSVPAPSLAKYEKGVEFYYASPQILSDRSPTRSTAEVGLFGEKTFGKFSLFINADNITDVRQGKYGPVVLPPYDNPTFAEVYTHLEGRIFNGGIKIRF